MAAKVGVVLSGCGYLDGAEVHESVLTLYFLEQKKPIVAICISPAVLAVALQRSGKSATLTIGNDRATADAVRSTGCTHADCPVEGAIVDEKNRIISTPAYMLGPGPKAVGAGIEQAISRLMSWL